MLTPWLWVALAWAGPEEAIGKLVETGDFEKAQKRCENVTMADEPALREVCAKASLPAAQQQNTVAGWQAYLARWSGTSLEPEAREAEAGAALYAAGHGGKEADYEALLARYPNSVVAAALTDRMGAAAIRDAFDGDEAVRVARRYPNHELLPGLVERYLGAFTQVAIGETGPVIRLDPPAGVAPSEVSWSWALRGTDGATRPWAGVAEAHLESLGLSTGFVDALREPGAQPFPPCLPLGVGGELGLALSYESGSAFVAAAPDPACAPSAPPALFVVSGGRMSAISLAPGHRMVLPPAEPPAQAPYFPWRDPSGVTQVFAPLPTGAPVLAGVVLGQPVGPGAESGPTLYLLSPIAGGMPWYVLTNPPPGAITLPMDFPSSPLPEGWTLQAGGQPVQPATPSALPVQVAGGGTDWWLPAGDPRVFSRLFAKITGLHSKNEAIERPRAEPLPPATGGGFTLTGQLSGPAGSAPVEFEAVAKGELSALPPAIAQLGIAVTRAWRLDLGPDAPHVLFEGAAKAGSKLRGVTDAAGRVFVWVKDERAQATPETPFAFRWRDRAYFAWTGSGSTGPYVEAVHFEGIGLVREFR